MLISKLTRETFQDRNRVDSKKWTDANITWDALRAIGEDFELHADALSDVAALHARLLQRCINVHSVRWRLKDPEHLLEKIVRKRAQNSDKYAQITPENYTNIVGDLVGLRALHLFKDDWRGVHKFLSDEWDLEEDPVAYVREGDSEEIRLGYSNAGCAVKIHPAGYRSVHYVVASHPQKIKVLAEIQVRTIFEEGWSEIDHQVRYPNFINNELVNLFLATFNRIAGSADEMGSFVRSLTAGIDKYESNVLRSREEVQNHLGKIEHLVAELSTEKQKSAVHREQLRSLSSSVEALRRNAIAATQPKDAADAARGLGQLLGGLLAELMSQPSRDDLTRARHNILKLQLDEASGKTSAGQVRLPKSVQRELLESGARKTAPGVTTSGSPASGLPVKRAQKKSGPDDGA